MTDDERYPLGIPDRTPKDAAPLPVKKVGTRDGIYASPDGKWFTNTPLPPPAPTIWDIYRGVPHLPGMP